MATQEMRKPTATTTFCGMNYVTYYLRCKNVTTDRHFERKYK